MKQGIIILVFISICLVVCNSSDVLGYTRVISLGENKITLFAPDWIWQGQNVNVMLVVDNKDVIENKIDVRISASEDNQKYFDLPEKMTNTGIAPTLIIARAVAEKVKLGVITSSPLVTPAARRDK